MYEDDGLSYDFRNGEYSLVRYECSQEEIGTEFKMTKREGRYVPSERSLLLKFNGFASKPSEVLRSGKPLPMTDSVEHLVKEKTGWLYDGSAKIVWVKFGDGGQEETVEVRN